MIDYDGPVAATAATSSTATSGHALTWSNRTDTKHFANIWLGLLRSLWRDYGYDYDTAMDKADKVLERYKEIYNGK